METKQLLGKPVAPTVEKDSRARRLRLGYRKTEYSKYSECVGCPFIYTYSPTEHGCDRFGELKSLNSLPVQDPRCDLKYAFTKAYP